MLFQLKMVYQKEDLYALSNAVAQNAAISRGRSVVKYPTRKIFYLVAGVLLILMGCFLIALPLAYGDWQPHMLALGGLTLFWGLLAFFFWKIPNINSWLTWKRYSPKNTEALVEFWEDYFAGYMPTSESRTSYTVIQSIFEDQAHYFLFASKNSAVIVRKDGFTVGDPNEFGTWIAEKTGEEITKLR